MTRPSFNVAVSVIAAGLLYSASTLMAQNPTTIHQGTAPEPIVLAVVADNFTQDEVDDFNDAAANLFTYGLFAEGIYKDGKDVFTVKTIFHPVPSTTRASRYGFRVGTDPASNCSIIWDQNGIVTDDAIHDDVSAAVPEAEHYVVVGNYDYTFGCRRGPWAYISAGSVGLPVMQHEMSHLVWGLFDEFSLPQHQSTTFPDGPLTRTNVNCSTNVTSPYWHNDPIFQGAAPLPGCALYGQGIVHAYHECTMGAHGEDFCPVCRRIIETEVSCLRGPELCNPTPNPTSGVPSPPSNIRVSGAGLFITSTQQPTRVLRLLLRVSRVPGTPIQVISANETEGRAVSRSRRLGDYVYEVSENGKPLAVAVIPGNPFETRSYRGGVTEHRSAESDTASVLISLADITTQMILEGKRNPAVAVYKLAPDVGAESITIENFNALRGKQRAILHAQLAAGNLREALKGLK